jgi:threonine dehydrogenase-like Zn-dependent dehydrogenase
VKPGTRVFGLMDVSETNTVDQSRVYPLGEIEPLIALCLEPAYVAFHCIRESNVRYGESVAVVGLGALGLLAVRMARESGAETVIAIDPLESRRRLAAAYGADHTFDPRAQDAALEAHKVTGGKGVDVAIELVGVYPALETAIRCARVGGTICSAGFYQGEANTVFFGREWHHNRLTMIVPHGCGWGHPPRDYPRWDQQRAYDTLATMMRKGRLDVTGLINLTIPFEDGAKIFDTLKNTPDQVIKYAIKF